MALLVRSCEVKEDLRFIIVSGPLGELQAYHDMMLIIAYPLLSSAACWSTCSLQLVTKPI